MSPHYLSVLLQIAPMMHYRSLLTDEEMNDILSQETVEEKNDVFLDLMETRNPGEQIHSEPSFTAGD